MRPLAKIFLATALVAAAPAPAQDNEKALLDSAASEAQRQLQQTFTNLSFEDFERAPIKGPIYQALAGGRIVYFAPESGQLIFGAVYDRNGVNLTALAQDAGARKRLAALDRADALVIGPDGAPEVVEFTDPECPYCQALERFWTTKAEEGKQVRRLIYFVSGIHPDAAKLAEHILCSPDKEAAFKGIFEGQRPATPLTCKTGAEKVARDARTVRAIGVSGTPTLIVDGRLISGFRQAELESFLKAKQGGVGNSP